MRYETQGEYKVGFDEHGNERERFLSVQESETERREITVYAFRQRFDTEEKRNIYNAAKYNVDIQIWLDDMASVKDEMIDLLDPATIKDVNALETARLIGVGRAAQILGA